MQELIDRYATIDAIPAPTDADEAEYYGKVCDAIEAMPTIKSEVKHGRWIRNATSDGYHCSNCAHHVDSPIGEMIDPRDYECYLDDYCGGCGAKMDEGANNDDCDMVFTLDDFPASDYEFAQHGTEELTLAELRIRYAHR